MPCNLDWEEHGIRTTNIKLIKEHQTQNETIKRNKKLYIVLP